MPAAEEMNVGGIRLGGGGGGEEEEEERVLRG